jgi:hypothetical protein
MAILTMLAAACSGVPAPEDVESCEELVEVGVDWVERTAIALEGQPLEVVTGDTEAPEELMELQMVGSAIDIRAAELGCDQALLNQAISTGVADLESDDPVVSLFLRLVQSNSAGSG